jgi:ubiquitin C-terminal hydrolase
VPQPRDDGSVNMLNEIQHLFRTLESQKKSSGKYDHLKFVKAVKKGNALFDNDEHHDSHEYVNWLLDELHESFIKARGDRPDLYSNYGPRESFVSEFFEGKLENTFMCLTCEKTKKRQEAFFNLSIDIEKNSSLTYCMQRFSVKELLNKGDKF